MATPYVLELIHAGIDEIIVSQAEKGNIKLNQIASLMDSDGQGYIITQRNAAFKDANVYGRGQTIEPSRKEKLDEYRWDPLLWAMAWDHFDYDSDEDFYKVLPDNIADAALSMIRTRHKEETNILNNGFSSSFPGVDGVSLFNTAHTGATGVPATQSNTPAAGSSLDVESVEADIASWMAQTDFNGESLYLSGTLEVWTGVTLAPLNWRICMTELQAGTPDNDKSYVSRLVKPMMSHQITSSTAYFYKPTDDSMHHLRMCIFTPYKVKERPMGGALDYRTIVYERRRAIIADWHGVYGNPGA